jgi:hypothetical protein
LLQLLDVLNAHFQQVFGITKLQSTMLQLAYFVRSATSHLLLLLMVGRYVGSIYRIFTNCRGIRMFLFATCVDGSQIVLTDETLRI